MRVIRGVVLVCAAALAGCGGGGGSGGPPQSPTGVWGFGSNDPTQPIAIIDSAGRAIFFRPDNGEFYDGTAAVSGSDLNVAVDGYSEWRSTFSDGSDHGTGKLFGTLTTGGTISASLSFTTDGGTPITADWTLPYYSFNESSSLAHVAGAAGFQGAFVDVNTLMFIDPSGVVTSQTASNGCVLTGSVSTADTMHNVYDVSISYSGCSGTWQELNGVQLTGLAFDSTNDVPGNLAPLQLTMLVTGASAAAKYAISYTLH